MAVVAAPIEEGSAIFQITLGRVHLPAVAVFRHAVPFQVAKMAVHRFGADKPTPPRRTPLRVELHHARFPGNPPRSRADAAPVPAPGTPVLQGPRHPGAPPPRIEPAASLSGHVEMLGIAARPTYGLMNRTEEARRAAAYPANPACVRAAA